MSKMLLVAIASITIPGILAASLSDSQLTSVKDKLAESAQRSWELGTRAQALLEYGAQTYSVFSDTPLPPPSSVTDQSADLSSVFDIARDIVSARQDGDGPQPLMEDGSAADPASNGVAVLLANWTGQGGSGGPDYAKAATEQLQFLLENVPRSNDGAISHRTSQAQLWSDFMYMVPPFFAYYGVLTSNETLVSEAYNQINLYRNHLRDAGANNLWKHIVLGSGTDEGHWSTGNGWAAAGMLRVLATIQNSQYSDSFSSQKEDLANWTLEIQAAMYNVIDGSNVFRNYPDDDKSFYDAAGTALMASTVYRLSQIWDDQSYISHAERSRNALYDGSHITSDGWLTPVVNPHSFGSEGSNSAEGQAFVLMMDAAHKDWVDAGSPGNGALQMSISHFSWSLVVALFFIFL